MIISDYSLTDLALIDKIKKLNLSYFDLIYNNF
jgi:hypothetical protein